MRLSGSCFFAASLALSVAGCGAPDPTPSTVTDDGDDLPIGDKIDEGKADGTWGDALKCKTIPTLPQLISPRITVSLNGLTLHVVDPVTGYDKVFPIGPGKIEDSTSAAAFGESKSYYPIIGKGGHDFAITPRTVNACRTWWTDPDTSEKSPVFAGLPFMPFYGAYAIHGPIDNYRAANGGTLRRGFVSHGCVRMEAADVAELYGRIKTLASVPVHLQREPERTATGDRVDLASRWIGAECDADADCNYTGGLCHPNAYGGRGFCSAACTTSCADRANLSTTFCVADPLAAGKGMCVNKTSLQNGDCRTFGQMKAQTKTRNGQSTLASVCVPASRGWVGDPCLGDSDCGNGSTCAGEGIGKSGVCTEACTAACPDLPNSAMTTCVADPVPGSGVARGCARTCTPSSNASECEGGTTCGRRDPNSATDTRFVCRRS